MRTSLVDPAAVGVIFDQGYPELILTTSLVGVADA